MDISAAVSQAEGRWQLQRSVDRMTGGVSCSAVSPKFVIPAKREYISAQLLAVVSQAGAPQVIVVNVTSGSIFHHNFYGGGLKVGAANMIPFGARPTQTILTMPPGTDSQIVDSMSRSTTALVRVRFWPWDENYDSSEVSLAGISAALASARVCAAKG